MNLWVNMTGFNHLDVREYDMLRIRRKQLLPLVPLYVTNIPILNAYKKKMKHMGLTEKPKAFELPWRCPLDAALRDLTLPGRLENFFQHGHAVVSPVASSFRNGRIYRQSPDFTFDGIQGDHEFFLLGADIVIEIREGRERLAKIVAAFMHTGPHPAQTPGDAPERAVYVQFYGLLNEYQPTSSKDRDFSQTAKANSLGTRELVLFE